MTESPATETLRRHGKSFAFAARFMGKAEADRGARLYAFCRYVDDIADGTAPPAIKRDRLERVRADILAGVSADPLVADFLDLAAISSIDIDAAEHLVEGAIQDTYRVEIADRDAMVRYAYAVAGTVGRMMSAVLGADDPRAGKHAVDLGIALQLTNIARDIGEDARMGRRYLPADWVGGATPAEIAEPDAATERDLEAATRRLLALADDYYRSGFAGLGYLPRGSRFAILVAGRVYREIGTRIAAAGYRSWDRRAYVPTAGKIFVAGRCGFEFVTRASLHRPGTVHADRLHAPLREIFGEVE